MKTKDKKILFIAIFILLLGIGLFFAKYQNTTLSIQPISIMPISKNITILPVPATNVTLNTTIPTVNNLSNLTQQLNITDNSSVSEIITNVVVNTNKYDLYLYGGIIIFVILVTFLLFKKK